ncbi:MAG: hypothetical protein AB7L84_14880 [Acidimicrobiia bacterium]
MSGAAPVWLDMGTVWPPEKKIRALELAEHFEGLRVNLRPVLREAYQLLVEGQAATPDVPDDLFPTAFEAMGLEPLYQAMRRLGELVDPAYDGKKTELELDA